MRIDAGIATAVLVVALSIHGLPAATEPLAPQEYTVGDVLDRIDRYQRNHLSHAREWYAGLERMTSAAAYLELALLEVYGPETVRNRPRGLERMNRLRQGEVGQLSSEVKRLLAILSAQVEASLEVEAECREIAERLAREQQEHGETREKLEALRMIERQLGSPPDNTEPDHDYN